MKIIIASFFNITNQHSFYENTATIGLANIKYKNSSNAVCFTSVFHPRGDRVWAIKTRDSDILYLSSSHRQTTWARRGTSESQDQSCRARYSRAGTATLPCPFGCNPLLSTLSCKCRCPPRRNRGRSKSDGGSPLPRSTSLCSHARNCTFHSCNARVRYNQALRIRRVAENIPSPSSQDCTGTPRLCTRLSNRTGRNNKLRWR